jgi:hypothetical protein
MSKDQCELAHAIGGELGGVEFGARAHSDDQGSLKLGYSVRPPSTNRVWPVM